MYTIDSYFCENQAMKRLRAGPSAAPSKSSHYVSAADRTTWDAKLDSADIQDFSTVLQVDEQTNAVTLLSTTSSVTLAPVTEFVVSVDGGTTMTSTPAQMSINQSLTVSPSGLPTVQVTAEEFAVLQPAEFKANGTTSVLTVGTGSTAVKNQLLVKPDGSTTALDVSALGISSSVSHTFDSGLVLPTAKVARFSGAISTPVTGLVVSVANLVLSISGVASLVNISPILADVNGVLTATFNAIDMGTVENGHRLSVILVPSNGTDLVSTNNIVVQQGFNASGASIADTSSPTAFPIATLTGSNVSIIGNGLLHFVFVQGFAAVAAGGAWVQM